MSQYDYDLFTIGGGSGGVRASRFASQYGARVAIAESKDLGGIGGAIEGAGRQALVQFAEGLAAREFRALPPFSPFQSTGMSLALMR